MYECWTSFGARYIGALKGEPYIGAYIGPLYTCLVTRLMTQEHQHQHQLEVRVLTGHQMKPSELLTPRVHENKAVYL